MHKPESFPEKETRKILWDFEIQKNHLILSRQKSRKKENLSKDPHPNEYHGYATKQSDCEVPVMLGLRGMRSTTSSLPLLPSPLWAGMVAPDKGPIYGLDRTELHTYVKLNCLNKNCLTKLNSLK